MTQSVFPDPAAPGANQNNLWKPNRAASKRSEKAVMLLFGAFAFVSVITTFGIIATLIFETIEFFRIVPPIEFFFSTRWTPLFADPSFGIIVLICGTFLTSTIALTLAIPLGLLAAICLSEYASMRARRFLKPILEVLAGIPSVVFGYFALLLVTPLLRSFIPGVQIFNALSAGIVLGFAILPTIASLSEDAIFAVPSSLKEGSYALGSTKRETIIGVVLPSALSGIVSAIILGVSRAVGETMIVTLAAGASPTLTLDPRVSIQTMTAFIVQVTKGDAPFGSVPYLTLYAVGTTLFVITLVLNLISFWFVRKYQEKYE